VITLLGGTVHQRAALQIVTGTRRMENRQFYLAYRSCSLIHSAKRPHTRGPADAIVGAARLVAVHSHVLNLPGASLGPDRARRTGGNLLTQRGSTSWFPRESCSRCAYRRPTPSPPYRRFRPDRDRTGGATGDRP
jgi:hypothetical protein